MKAIVMLLVLGAAAYAVFHYSGGVASFDPTEEGRKAKAAIGPGMSWQKVTSAAREPRFYNPIQKRTKNIQGEKFDILMPGPRAKFESARLAERIKENSLPHGFRFEFVYSAQAAFAVNFDSSGTVTGVEDIVTMADLLQTRDRD